MFLFFNEGQIRIRVKTPTKIAYLVE